MHGVMDKELPAGCVTGVNWWARKAVEGNGSDASWQVRWWQVVVPLPLASQQLVMSTELLPPQEEEALQRLSPKGALTISITT